MKGRTTCPKCKNEFMLDLPDTCKKTDVVCPKCDHTFTIQLKPPVPGSGEECSWEEHGEPRKTILSSIKPKTNRPMLAGILLICVFAIGLTTAVFAEAFVETSMDLASGIGMKGSIKILVTDSENNSLENISIKIDESIGKTNEKGLFSTDNTDLGIITLEISYPGYKTQKRDILVTPFFKSESTIIMEPEDGEETRIEFDAIGCSLILGIFSIFALLGTIACIKRQHVDVAIASSLVGIFSIGFFLIGSIISIIAFAIIITSKEEFENGKKGKIF